MFRGFPTFVNFYFYQTFAYCGKLFQFVRSFDMRFVYIGNKSYCPQSHFFDWKQTLLLLGSFLRLITNPIAPRIISYTIIFGCQSRIFFFFKKFHRLITTPIAAGSSSPGWGRTLPWLNAASSTILGRGPSWSAPRHALRAWPRLVVERLRSKHVMFRANFEGRLILDLELIKNGLSPQICAPWGGFQGIPSSRHQILIVL